MSTIFQQINEIYLLIRHIKTSINNANTLSANVQVTEFEKLIEDCNDNLTISSIVNYKTKLEEANMQLIECRKEEEKHQKKEEKRQKEEEKHLKEEEKRQAEQRRIEQSNRWQTQGLCRHCGGKFSGIFSKKCTNCGRAKDY